LNGRGSDAHAHSLLVDGGVDLGGDDGLLSDGAQDGAHDVLAVGDGGLDLLSDVAIRDLQVVTGVAGVVHQGQVAIIDVQELVVPPGDVGHVHVMCGRADILVFAVGEDVECDHVHLGVAVLAGLGRGHLNDLAGAALNHDESSLPQCRALHGVGVGGAGIGDLEIEVISHYEAGGVELGNKGHK